MRMEDLVAAIKGRRVRITDHADEAAADDDLRLDEIYHSVQTGQIIEDYPDDRPYPSCLVYGRAASGAPVHTVWAYNEDTAWAVLITVYRPAPEKWIDWRERRK